MKYYTIENLKIIDAGSEGKAVGKMDGLTVFVPFAVPGDVVDVEVFKKKKNFAEARLLAVKENSPDRIQPVCEHFGLCGGCKWQNMTYSKQLFYKQKQVDDNFRHLGKFDYPPVMPIIASDYQLYYRNKLEYTFTDLRWLDEQDYEKQKEGPIDTRGLGFHIPLKFDKVLDINNCHLQSEPGNAIRLAIKQFAIENEIPFYNIRNHEGIFRNVIIRSSSSNEWMVIIVVSKITQEVMRMMEFLSIKFPMISSLQYVINPKLNDTITDLDIILFKGTPHISENMEDLTFKVGPVSFFQTNSQQAYKLYSVAREFADIAKDNIVYDLYTGTGTIANFIARKARKVVGIEYVDAAIEDARENSQINGIKNTVFFAGDIVKVLTAEFVKENGTPDIIITDPPRAGMHSKVIERILEIKPEKIVYISCNPATQARDITLLSESYKISKVQPVDMFPHTQHVENVALLEIIKK
jgi:23S rRNA (uracil1939-C5)-methyltransferase